MSEPAWNYCSRCGRRISGACLSCYQEMKDDLHRRQRIQPGCPAIKGEFRSHIEEALADRNGAKSAPAAIAETNEID